ncbi:hypothetical protein DIT68_00915 [Brumimicrobium oceani]|uniref:Uncharacterized protein n=2 Tax=Brumimicrobium oceani TaxID=2100725 RepID=A0A2U2XGD9_9FLAO|nr:hypothetical protein DIT68_00915 [Brumimicrobium oceani]
MVLLLFSCGTSSNGVFEKRKHLKGWHFKKNKKFDLGLSSNKKKEEIRIEKNAPNNTNKVSSFVEKERNSQNKESTPFRKENKTERLEKEKKYWDEKPDILLVKDENEAVGKDLKTFSSMGVIAQVFIKKEGAELDINKRTVISDDKVLSSNQILIRTFFVVVGFGILFLAFFILAWAIAYNDPILGLSVFAFGVVLCFTFVDYLVQRLHSRPEDRKNWTFFRSLKRVLILLSALVLTIYTINFLTTVKENMKN